MDVLFFLRTLNLDRLYEPLLTELASRGHRVRIVVERDRHLAEGAGAVVARLADAFEGVTVERLGSWPDPWLPVRRELRAGLDYLRYLEPAYADADALRKRARERALPVFAALDPVLRRSARGRALLRTRLARWDAAAPIPAAARAFVAERSPDVVLVAPLVSIGSPQADWVAVASELGIPNVLPVASWDNLTNKGLVKQSPTAVLVWNAAQAEEAIALHRIPPERVHVVGAHSFDPWFRQRPSLERRDLLARAGLPADRPYLLYLASSRFIAGDETGFVREWIARIRASGDPAVAGASVLVRPHPLNAEQWAAFESGDPAVAVWPRGGEMPTDERRRALFFDSLAHASAIVGINTTAMIEAAIVGRPSLTVLDPRFRGSQTGTLHFAHIAGDLVLAAPGWDEHLADLSDVLAAPERHQRRLAAFVESFLRPAGRDMPAAPAAVDAIEATAAQPLAPLPRPAPSFALRLVHLADRAVRWGRRIGT